MLRLVWSTDSGDSTMSPMLWCHCIGCASQNVFSSNWRSWFTEFFTATLQNTSDCSLGCPTCRVDHHTVLHHPTIFSSRQFVARRLVQGRFRWPGQLFGTVCPLTLRRLTVCQFFIIVLKIIYSLIRIQALFNNCTIFYRGLEAFYIALGHVNPIGNYYCYYWLHWLCELWSVDFWYPQVQACNWQAVAAIIVYVGQCWAVPHWLACYSTAARLPKTAALYS